MPISYASNSASGKVQTQIGQVTKSLGETFERLSSGLRINHPKDDPGGLMLADKMRLESRLAAVAIRNANDGLSITSIMESSLDDIGNMLVRMSELAEQSANGVIQNSQRSALQYEFDALGSEIDRVYRQTTFNNVMLLSTTGTALQVGLDNTYYSNITISAIPSGLNDIGLAGTTSTALTFSLLSNQYGTELGAQAASDSALSAIRTAIDTLSYKKGILGSAQSRLEFAIDYITVTRENFVAAESAIRDANVAQDVADAVRLQVLQQAANAVFAQANQQYEVVLGLLKT